MDSEDDVLKKLGIDKIAPAVYDDLLKPAIKELGEGALLPLAKTVGHLLSPILAFNYLASAARAWLPVRVAKILSERGISEPVAPAPSVSGPALMNLVFSIEIEELREMYAQLLASAMDPESRESVLPAFATVVQQLSPDEALLLRRLAGQRGLLLRSTGQVFGLGGRVSRLKRLADEVGMKPDRFPICLTNLVRLGILREDVYVDPESRKSPTMSRRVVVPKVREIQLTAFGSAFLATCTAPDGPLAEAESAPPGED